MMCLMCSVDAKKLVELWERLTERGVLGGMPLTFYLARERKYKGNSLALWTVLIRVSNEALLKQLKDKRSLDKSFGHLARGNGHILLSFRKVKFCFTKAFFEENPGSFFQSLKSQSFFQLFLKKITPLQPEPSCNGPPKGFTPLPDTEIGGCARSDSTVPAI